MDFIIAILKDASDIGQIFLILLGVFLGFKYRKSILEFFKNGNGNGNTRGIEDLSRQVEAMNSNHLHTLSEKADKLHEKIDILTDTNREILFNIKEMRRDNGKK